MAVVVAFCLAVNRSFIADGATFVWLADHRPMAKGEG
jgi:hypothetical protein